VHSLPPTDVAGLAERALTDALADAIREYTARNPASRALFERAQRVMPGGNTRTAIFFEPFPLYIPEGAGAYIVDADGHRYLDVLGEYTAGLFGHSERRILDAAFAAAAHGVSNGGPNVHEIELAELLCARFPSLAQVRFCNSGTEANLYALSLARVVTGRSRFLCFQGAYHGGVFVFAQGGSPINAPFEWIIGPYNDAERTVSSIRAVGADLAGVIMEPMLTNAGCIPATKEFISVVREECSRSGAALIFDEVVTSRHGEGGLQGLLGVRPDLTTFGKYIGGGFSFGAFGGRAQYMARMDPRRADAIPHAGTFNNNVFSMSAGAMALRSVYTAERAQALFQSGESLLNRLNELCRRTTTAVQFTGMGSTINVHFHRGVIHAPEDLAREPKGLITLFHFDLLAQGIYAARRGQLNLSLPMGQEEEESICQAVRAFLNRRIALIEAVTPSVGG
jgi:glutamate-1-semialdehyde 2,1-aminomutase